MERVDKKSKMSCNQQLKEMLRELIRKNWKKPGFTLPSEEWLCEFHQLARGTVRKAVGELVAENLLIRRPGKGTFINSACAEEHLMNNVGGLVAMITTLGPGSFSTSDLALGIDSVCSQQGYFLVLKGTGINQPEAEIKALEILGRRCDGIITYSMCDQQLIPAYAKLIERGFPMVMVDRYFPELDTDRVVVDERAGTKEAAEMLIRLGCPRIIHLTVDRNLSSVKLRHAGFEDACAAHPEVNHSVETVQFMGLEKNQTDRTPLRRLIEKEVRDWPQVGLVCLHDGLASLAYDACQEARIPVPNRVMIMGYGDEPSARERQISTMHFSFEEMGKAAANILLDKIERRSRKRQHVRIHSEMILRKSTQHAN